MKNTIKIALCLFLLFFYEKINAQQLYSPEATKKLKHIVDSLNLKFKKYESNKTYLSLPQAIGHIVSFGGVSDEERKNIMEDIKKNISFEAFEKKYPFANFLKNQLIIFEKGISYENKKVIRFSSLDLMKDKEVVYEIDEPKKIDIKNYKKNNWYYNPQDYYRVVFLIENFSQKKISKKYAKMIDYVDCITDTTTKLIVGNTGNYNKEDYIFEEFDNKLIAFEKEFYTKNKRIHLRNSPYYYSEDFKQIENPDSYFAMTKDSTKFFSVAEFKKLIKEDKELRIAKRKQEIEEDEFIRKKFNDESIFIQKMYKHCIDNYTSNENFEKYAKLSLTDEQMLELKRRRNPSGSHGERGTYTSHVVEIAKLAIKTSKWNIFILAQLDAINQGYQKIVPTFDLGYFSGHYDYTYIENLENLNLNTLDLLLGAIFNVKNAANNHYFGGASRTGIALAQSKKIENIENKILEIISDKSLDLYNRGLMYFLYLSYTRANKNSSQNFDKLQKTLEKTKEPFWKNIDYLQLKKIYSYVKPWTFE